MAYDSRPGNTKNLAVSESSNVSKTHSNSAAPGTWPVGTSIKRPTDAWSLVVAAHAKCPCTRATISELNRVLGRVHNNVHVIALLFRPSSEKEWLHSDISNALAETPKTTIVDDMDGLQAAKFGATTSGEVFLYGPDGTLQFHGGITSARGHEGDSVGADSVVKLVNLQSSSVRQTPTFGCSL